MADKTAHILFDDVSESGKPIETWYISYALLGATVAGLIPILLPLSVIGRGTIADVGYVMAAFNLGGLISPVWGRIADRRLLYRELLAGGLLVTALTLAIFPWASSLWSWVMLAFLQGTGAGSAATVANLFIVELHPEREWDKRIGWLQSFYGGGQVFGLILAGVLSRISMHAGLYSTAVITALAIIPAWFMTPIFPRLQIQRPILRQPVQSEIHIGSPQRLYMLISPRKIWRGLHAPFALFISAWLITFMGAAAFFSLYPVLMNSAYGVDPVVASVGFAVAAALGLALYPAAGIWSEKFGSIQILQIGFGVRILAFTGLITIGSGHVGSHAALFSFLFIVLAWSLLSVAGTAVTSELSKSNEGEGLGVFNAATAVAGVLGAVIGGWLAGEYGYDAIPIFALISITGGLAIVSLLQKFRQ